MLLARKKVVIIGVVVWLLSVDVGIPVVVVVCCREGLRALVLHVAFGVIAQAD